LLFVNICLGDLDELIYNYDDFLVVVAAGNDGKKQTKSVHCAQPHEHGPNLKTMTPSS
jgi:hypothetical protein